MNFLDRWFGLREHRSSFRAELLGGITTFATMAYIIVTDPAILAEAGIPAEASIVARFIPVGAILAAMCAVYYVFGRPH